MGFLVSKEVEVVNLGGTVYITVTNILSNAIFSMDFLDFEGKGMGKELRKFIGEMAELMITPDLSNLYPILGALDFQGIQKKRDKELLMAGTNSTSIVIEWAMAERMKNQNVMDKPRDELERGIGTNIVKESHLAHLPYLEACVKETLRLHPLGWAILLLPHHALQTCQVMGYTVP
nr:corytuberine synthase-like [Quercus suber]